MRTQNLRRVAGVEEPEAVRAGGCRQEGSPRGESPLLRVFAVPTRGVQFMAEQRPRTRTGVEPTMKICPNCQRSYPAAFAVCPQDGGRLTESVEWSPGTVIRGKYRILGRIGEGGMGAVYKALHMHFDEFCALKVMAPNLLHDKALVKRFGHEAIFARKLRHKNAVRVEDFDETEDGRPFIVMEFIEGQSLKRLMESTGPLSVARVCSIAEQTASALDAAHRIGLVHRDIKPDNIVLLNSQGKETAKVLDFGIAKIRDGLNTVSGMSLTGTGMIIGTPPYMSPEQAQGASGDQLDGRSDLYSLGVVMYQMLTGVLPLKADTPLNMLLAQIQTPPTPICEARPGVKIPEPLATIVMKCLEKEPDRRPQTGEALIQQLECCQEDPQATFMTAETEARTDPYSDAAPPARTPQRALPKAQSADSVFEASEAAAPIPLESRTPEAKQGALARRQKALGVANVEPARETDAGRQAAVEKDARTGSRTWVYLLAFALLLALGSGGLYAFRVGLFGGPHGSAVEGTEQSPSSTQPAAVQPDQPPVVGPGQTPQASGTRGPQVLPAPAQGSSSGQRHSSNGSPLARAAPQISDAERVSRAKKAEAAMNLGDLYYENGAYDNAIKEYELGMQLDPTSKALRQRLEQAQKAKAARGVKH